MNNNFWDIYYLLNTIEINKNNKIQIASVKKDNTVGIDIRKFYKKGEEWNHGKGITIPADKLEEFQSIISDIKK